jgi:hypothetical protein
MPLDGAFSGTPSTPNVISIIGTGLAVDVVGSVLYFTDPSHVGWQPISIGGGGTTNWSSLTGTLSNGQVIPYGDAGISRLGAASLAMGNGTNGNFTGILKLSGVAVLGTGGTVPSPADSTPCVAAFGQTASVVTTTQTVGIYCRSTQTGYLLRVVNELGNIFDMAANGSIGYYSDQNFGNNNIIVGTAQGVRLQSNGLMMASGSFLGWTATTHAYDTLDTGISRIGAGVLAVGNGTAGNVTGQMQMLYLTVGNYIQSAGSNLQIVFDNAGSRTYWQTGATYPLQINATALTLKAAELFNWTSTTSCGDTADTGFSRVSAGVVALGLGTAGSTIGQLNTKVIQLYDNSSNPQWVIDAGGQVLRSHSGGTIGFSVTTATSGLDTGLSRLGAASLALGNGTFQDFTATLKLGNILITAITDVTTGNVSISAHGFAPKAPNDATKYLDGTGAYSVPAGGGAGSTSLGLVIVTARCMNML